MSENITPATDEEIDDWLDKFERFPSLRNRRSTFLRSLIARIRAEQAKSIQINPLDWIPDIDTDGEVISDIATTPFGQYYVERDTFSYSPTTAYYASGPNGFRKQCAKEVEAFAAAQQDYETRIRSALVEAKSTAEPVGWRWRFEKDGPWSYGAVKPSKFTFGDPEEVEPLYTHPAPEPSAQITEIAVIDAELGKVRRHRDDLLRQLQEVSTALADMRSKYPESSDLPTWEEAAGDWKDRCEAAERDAAFWFAKSCVVACEGYEDGVNKCIKIIEATNEVNKKRMASTLRDLIEEGR